MSSNINEKDALNDLLIQEKSIIQVYGTFLAEGSTPQLRNILKKNMDVVAKQQFDIFTAMQEKGYYQAKEAEEIEIDQAKKQFAKSGKSSSN